MGREGEGGSEEGVESGEGGWDVTGMTTETDRLRSEGSCAGEGALFAGTEGVVGVCTSMMVGGEDVGMGAVLRGVGLEGIWEGVSTVVRGGDAD